MREFPVEVALSIAPAADQVEWAASFSGGNLGLGGRIVSGDVTKQINVYVFNVSGPGTYPLDQQ